MRIILGSGSKRRQQLLADAGFEFDVEIPRIDEKAIRSDDLRQLPLMIAQAKSDVLKNQVGEAILVACDTIVVHKNQLREKPKDESEAREFLKSYSQAPAEVICGLVVTNTATGKTVTGTESAKVYFLPIPDAVIHELVLHGAIMDAAGGFMAQMPAIKKYIAHIDGGMDTVMGLPRMLVKKLISDVS